MIYNILCNTLIVAKPSRIRFDEINGFIRVYYGNRYLVLFGLKKYDAIYDRIKYLVSQKSGITYAFSHYYTKIKVDSYGSFAYRKNIETA